MLLIIADKIVEYIIRIGVPVYFFDKRIGVEARAILRSANDGLIR